MLPRPLQSSLSLLQLVAVATLMRSVAFDRWITVVASVVLLVAAAAARRGKSWGVALAFAQAAAFPTAVLIGIAPPWFMLVGIAGALPFLMTSSAFARVDRGATRLLAALAVAAGALGAVAWKAYAWSVFEAFPALLPSRHPHHGWLVAAIAALGVATAARRSKRETERDEARVRVAPALRVADDASAEDELTESGLAAEDGLEPEPYAVGHVRRDPRGPVA